MKNFANFITVSRIFASIILIFTNLFSFEFFLVYTYCGVSDILDGFFARNFGIESEFGAKIDSFADLFFVFSAGIKILPTLINIILLNCFSFCNFIFLLIILTAVVKFFAYIVGWIKFHCFTALHTYLNKFVGIGLFMLCYGIIIFDIEKACVCIGSVALVATIEEFFIILFCTKYISDIKTIFQIGKYK